jgi:hypothetical protein
MLIGTSTFFLGSAARAASGLTGSPYDGTDGTADALVVFHNDQPSGSNDNSYVQGATEAAACPAVDTTHGTPPKDDILSYAVASSRGTNGHVFLYLAWNRATNNGDTTIEYELNQSTTRCSNGVNPVRTPGDLRIVYNFSGGTVTSILKSTWNGTWSAEVAVAAAQEEASIYNSPDQKNPDALNQLFGEAVIDLTASGVFEADSCTTLASAFARSRSSSQSNSDELKDLVLPIGETISNCGSVSMHKTDDNGAGHAALAGASFGLYTNQAHTTLATAVTGDNPCLTNALGNCSWTNVQPGTYYVHEVAPAPANYALDDTTATVVVTAGENTAVANDFVDPRDVGNLRIFKALEDQDHNAVVPADPADLNGASFTVLNASDSSQAKIWTDGSNAGCTVDNTTIPKKDGYCDVGPLATGDYIVHETVAPPGTGLTAQDMPVTITKNQVCAESVAQQCFAEVTMTNLNVGTPGILVEKSGPAVAHEGDKVTYSFKVTNTGNVTLTGISVTDDVLGDIGTIDTLLPGASQTLTHDYTIPAGSTADIKNTATACGTDALDTQVCDTDTHTLDVIHPAITIDKTVNNPGPHNGDTVTFSYLVTNTGDTTLLNVSVDDDVLGHIGDIASFAPGATKTLTKDEVVSPSTPLTNVGTAKGKDVLGREVSANDNATIQVVAGLVIEKPEVAPLAVTGASITLELQWAAGLMVIGILLSIASRRRLRAQPIE